MLADSLNFLGNVTTCNETVVDEDDSAVVCFWTLVVAFGILTNVLIFIGICRNKKMRVSTSYWLILSLSICDTGMLVISIAMLVPATALHEKYMRVDSWFNALGLFVYDTFWYTGVLHLALMALNRYVNICQPKYYLRLFGKRRIILEITAIYCMGTAIALPGVFPCCILVYDHCIYAARYMVERTQYAYVDVTVNCVSTAVMLFCYACIIIRVRQTRVALNKYRRMVRQSTRLQYRSNGSSFKGGSPKLFVSCMPTPNPIISRRELRLFFQFCAVSSIFLLTFATWQWLPYIFTSKWMGFVVTTLFLINNCTNPTVYLIFNVTLRREVAEMLCGFSRSEQRVLRLPGQTNFLLAASLPYSLRKETDRILQHSVQENGRVAGRNSSQQSGPPSQPEEAPDSGNTSPVLQMERLGILSIFGNNNLKRASLVSCIPDRREPSCNVVVDAVLANAVPGAQIIL